jgi:Putative zinc-finger
MEENSFMASGERKKSAGNLLREGLRDSGQPCPDSENLAAYFDQSLDANEKDHFELHLSQCPICREQIAVMHRASEPAQVRGVERPKPSWAWLWNWRWLAPVAAALVIAAIWITQRPASKPASEQHPLVAMSQPQPPPAAPATPEYARNEAATPQNAMPAEKSASEATRDFPPIAKSSRMGEAPTVLDQQQELAPTSPGSGKELQTDSLTKEDHGANARAGVTNSTAPLIVSVAPPPSPPANANGAIGHAQVTAAPASDARTISPQPATLEAKNNRAPAAEPLSAQRVQSKALALPAVERRSDTRIIRTPDPQALWRIAEGGFVERSKDGGTSWQGQLPDVNAQLTAGFAPSTDVCWVVGRNGAIFLTINASDWKRIQPPITADFASITAQDSFSALVTTTDGRKYLTTDGGAHWSSAP